MRLHSHCPALSSEGSPAGTHKQEFPSTAPGQLPQALPASGLMDSAASLEWQHSPAPSNFEMLHRYPVLPDTCPVYHANLAIYLDLLISNICKEDGSKEISPSFSHCDTHATQDCC